MGGEAAVYLDDLEDREIAPAVDQRTKPLHPTHGPGDGRDWAAYFRDMKGRTLVDAEPEPEDDPDEREVIERGYDMDDVEIAALSARSKPAQVVKRLRGAGWQVRVRRSLVRVPAVLFLNDSDQDAENPHLKGDVRSVEYELETICVLGTASAKSGRPVLVVDATWTSKDGFSGATTYDPALKREWRAGYLKPRKPNEIEMEDEIVPPMSLSEWLNIVCPKPEPKKRVKKEEA